MSEKILTEDEFCDRVHTLVPRFVLTFAILYVAILVVRYPSIAESEDFKKFLNEVPHV